MLEPLFWSAVPDGHHIYLNADNVWQPVALPTDLQHGEQLEVTHANLTYMGIGWILSDLLTKDTQKENIMSRAMLWFKIQV
jgi:hypothetical protein